MGDNLNCTSVIIPSVPSEPINKFVRLYPAEVFFVLAPVLIISPFGRTTVRPETVSYTHLTLPTILLV